MTNKRILSKEFSKSRKTLILQIRWLLNEIEYAVGEIESENIVEALIILKKETEKDVWKTIKDK